VHHLHALEARGQAELASLVRDRHVRLVAVGAAGEGDLAADLNALVSATQLLLPPLRDRVGDAVQWADFFVARAASDLGVPKVTLAPRTLAALASYRWPGNLTELESVIRRAVVLRRADVIEPWDVGFSEPLAVRPLNDAVEEFRMAYVLKVLAHFGGNRTQTARALGIDARTVFRYLAKTKEET
jgi:two-component system response regulator HydG